MPDHDSYRVLRVDLRSHKITRSGELGGPQLAIAYGAGGVWVVGADNSLRRLDPTTLEVTRGLAGDGIALGAGAVWSADGASSVWRLSGDTAQRIRAGAGPIDVAAGRRSVWVVNWRGHTLARIDGSRRRVVRRFSLGREPVAVLPAAHTSASSSVRATSKSPFRGMAEGAF